jgi:hypothetical protein
MSLISSRILLWSAALIFSAASAFGADFSGIWSGQITDRNGDLQDLSFRFTQNGDKVTGKMYGDNESIPLGAVTVSGDQITFMVTTELNGGVTKFLYTGKMVGSEIDLERKRIGVKPDPAAKDAAAAAQAAQNQNNRLRLKRLA